MKKILALVMAAAMALSLAACGGTTSTPASTGESTPASEPASVAAEGGNLVGVAMPTKDLQRWNQDGENMKAQLEAAGYTVDLQYAANDIPTQVSQIENMIANGCEVLVIASIDGDKTYNIEYITGDPGDNNINFFFDGAISVLQPYIDAGTLVCPSGQTEKQTVATANWASDAAQARFENILASYYADGTNLDVVLASNDSIALGAVNALASSYTGEYPVLTGQDCDIANVKNIVAGTQSMSVFKDTRDLAAKTVEMVDALMRGTEPPINDTETYDNGTGIIPSYL